MINFVLILVVVDNGLVLDVTTQHPYRKLLVNKA